MAKRTYSTKPGAERNKFKPDVIETYQVAEEAALLEFLIGAMPQRKRTAIKNLLSHNQIAVNGIPATQFDMALKAGDEVKANLTREFRVFYNRRLKLVYEDDDIIVVNKGYGLLSMGTDKIKEGTAYSILREYLKWQDPRNKLFIVHRLDRDTSGLMVFAKSQEAKDKLQHNWNNMSDCPQVSCGCGGTSGIRRGGKCAAILLKIRVLKSIPPISLRRDS